MSFPRLVARSGAGLALVVLGTRTTGAEDRHLEIPPPAVAERSRAYSYANSSDDKALAELARRGLPYTRLSESVPGVRTPVRLSGPLHGVTIHSSLPKEARATTPFEILDARLALALDDFCEILANHDVVEVVHFTIYRPNDSGSPEKNGGLPRHPGGMAIDVGAFRKRGGSFLTVLSDWPAAIGAKTCGSGARKILGRKGRELMSLLCEAADSRLFNVMLTPHFNRAHRDHVHLEIKADVKWFLVH
jgi:hypothetical protein